jgi:hypothetical protein
MCYLLSLHYKVYCMFSFLSSKPKNLLLTDVFQYVASRVPNLVIFLSLIRRWRVHWSSSVNFNGIPPPSAGPWPFFIYSCAVADSHSSLMECDRQFDVSINYHYICEHISCNSVSSWPLFQADLIPIPNFQYSWPHKESRPESHTYVLFYHCLCVRYGRNGHHLDGAVCSFFMPNTDPRLTLSKVSSRLDILHRLSGTYHKLWRNASYHVSHIFLLVMKAS